MAQEIDRIQKGSGYHEDSPGGVVEKDCGSHDEHCQAHEFVKLAGLVNDL